MSLIGDIASRLLAPLVDAVKKALGPFGKLFDLLSHFWTSLTESVRKGTELTDSIVNEVRAWQNFAVSVPIRTGVINIPKAVEQTRALIDEIKAAWASIQDLVEQIKNQMRGQQGDPAEEAEAAVKDIESSGVKTLLERFPKLAKGLEKALGFLTLVIGVLETLQATIDDLTAILAAIRGIREEVEHGSTIFLQQKNPRKALRLADGGAIHIRVGQMHS